MNINTVKQALIAHPDLSALSDADAATALSAPIFTPRIDRITYTTIGAVWGAVRAAGFSLTIEGARAQTANQQIQALATYADKVLGGAGFDATNPEAANSAAVFVAAGFATQVEITGLFNTTSYLCGGLVAAADVTAARAAIGTDKAAADLRGQWAAVYNRGIMAIERATMAGQPLPTLDTLRAGAAN
jgi:hypothetical protein